MKFSELSRSCYFVAIKPNEESLLLGKDSKGEVKIAQYWLPYPDSGITDDTEVQPVCLKK